MFINFWYPAGTSSEFTETPVKRQMLGQNFVLFRDADGVARCLSNVCPHRGGSLATGRVKGNCIECPYHGWQFNGEGHCERIPSLGPDGKIPARARVDAYPTRERYGLVFCFLGDLPEDQRPPIMDIPEYPDSGVIDGWRATHQHFLWDIDYKRSIENGIDSAHNEFVHPTHGFSGQRDDYRIEPLKLVETEWGTGFFNRMFAPPLAEEKMRGESGREENAVIETGTGHHGCSSLWTYIHPTSEVKIHQYAFETPVTETQTSIYLVNLRNFVLDPADDERMMTRNAYVAGQDRDILESLEPVLTPYTNTRELFVPADSAIGRYRQLVKEWEARGWRIDSDEVFANRRKVAYAVPSPARREHKGWILDALPLMPAGKTA